MVKKTFLNQVAATCAAIAILYPFAIMLVISLQRAQKAAYDSQWLFIYKVTILVCWGYVICRVINNITMISYIVFSIKQADGSSALNRVIAIVFALIISFLSAFTLVSN